MPMQFEVTGLEYDDRISNFMISARADYEWYLAKTDGSEENLEIQRDIIKGSKPYKNLRTDLRLGCILPTIVLAISDIDESVTQKYAGQEGFINPTRDDLDQLCIALKDVQPSSVNIVDGLQRTNALRQVLSELDDGERAKFLARSIRLEIWLNIPFYPLAYRMLLLNAGQRPMSMKHQIDILSTGLADDLSDLEGLEIIKVKDRKRRVKPGQFHLSVLAQAFQAWLQRSPNVDRTNLVVETMIVDEALESLGIDLAEEGEDNRDSFRQCVEWMIKLDTRLGADHVKFFGNDTVILGFAAAIGFCHKNERLNGRITGAMHQLIENTDWSDANPMGIETFDQIRRGIDTKKFNVGEATRNLVFHSFREFILQEGASSMEDCWTQSASLN
jgi:hypothetical protein